MVLWCFGGGVGLLKRRRARSEIFASADFARWYRVGVQPAFPVGECPSFYPLPATTPGAGPPPEGAGTPTHVYKVSRDGHDVAMVGTYAAGEPARPDNFSATPGVPFALATPLQHARRSAAPRCTR